MDDQPAQTVPGAPPSGGDPSTSKPNYVLWVLVVLALAAFGFLAWRFTASTGSSPSSQEDGALSGLVSIPCNGKTVQVIPPADSFSVRLLIPESEVASGADVRSLIECYFAEYQDTTFITGAIGASAFEAQSAALGSLGEPDALSEEELALLDTRTFTGQRNPDNIDIQLPHTGPYAE